MHHLLVCPPRNRERTFLGHAETSLHSHHHSPRLLYDVHHQIPLPCGSNELVFVLVLKRLQLVLRLEQQRVHGVVTVKSFCAALAAEIASHHDARIYRRLR